MVPFFSLVDETGTSFVGGMVVTLGFTVDDGDDGGDFLVTVDEGFFYLTDAKNDSKSWPGVFLDSRIRLSNISSFVYAGRLRSIIHTPPLESSSQSLDDVQVTT